MTYKDKTYCIFWRLCRAGEVCHRRLTKKVRAEAIMEYGKPFITYLVMKPTCFDSNKLERLHLNGYRKHPDIEDELLIVDETDLWKDLRWEE